MRTRIISGAVLTAILVGAVAGGRITMFLLSLVITCLGMFELYRVVGIHKSPLGIVGYILAAAYYALLWFDKLEFMDLYCVACGIIIMFAYVCSFKTKKASQAAFALLGIFYVAIPLSFLYRIRIIDKYGIYLFILLFVCSWIADTFAYFTGVTFGKHKLVPHLSPKNNGSCTCRTFIWLYITQSTWYQSNDSVPGNKCGRSIYIYFWRPCSVCYQA